MRFSKVWVVSFLSFSFCCDFFLCLFVMRGLLLHFYPLQKLDQPFLFWYALPIFKRRPSHFTGLSIIWFNRLLDNNLKLQNRKICKLGSKDPRNIWKLRWYQWQLLINFSSFTVGHSAEDPPPKNPTEYVSSSNLHAMGLPLNPGQFSWLGASLADICSWQLAVGSPQRLPRYPGSPG